MIYRVKKFNLHYEIWEMHSETAVDTSVRLKFLTLEALDKFIEENLKGRKMIWEFERNA